MHTLVAKRSQPQFSSDPIEVERRLIAQAARDRRQYPEWLGAENLTEGIMRVLAAPTFRNLHIWESGTRGENKVELSAICLLDAKRYPTTDGVKIFRAILESGIADLSYERARSPLKAAAELVNIPRFAVALGDSLEITKEVPAMRQRLSDVITQLTREPEEICIPADLSIEQREALFQIEDARTIIRFLDALLESKK